MVSFPFFPFFSSSKQISKTLLTSQCGLYLSELADGCVFHCTCVLNGQRVDRLVEAAHTVSPACSSVDGAVASAVATATLDGEHTHWQSGEIPALFLAAPSESNFSLLLSLNSLAINTGCRSGVWWKSVEETTVRAHLSQQSFLRGEPGVPVSEIRAEGSTSVCPCSKPSRGLINNLHPGSPLFSLNFTDFTLSLDKTR